VTTLRLTMRLYRMPFMELGFPCQIEERVWVLNERGERILWLPQANQGDGRWYGQKLAVGATTVVLLLSTFQA
jgi:hypothetical protein